MNKHSVSIQTLFRLMNLQIQTVYNMLECMTHFFKISLIHLKQTPPEPKP